MQWETTTHSSSNDGVFQWLNAQLSVAEDAVSKGFVAEKALCWHLFRSVLVKKSAIPEILQHKLVVSVPPAISSCHLTVQASTNRSLHKAFDADSLDLLFNSISTTAGPDLLFCCRNEASKLVCFLIQDKAKEEVDLKDALQSVNPGFMFTTKPQRDNFNAG